MSTTFDLYTPPSKPFIPQPRPPASPARPKAGRHPEFDPVPAELGWLR